MTADRSHKIRTIILRGQWGLAAGLLEESAPTEALKEKVRATHAEFSKYFDEYMEHSKNMKKRKSRKHEKSYAKFLAADKQFQYKCLEILTEIQAHIIENETFEIEEDDDDDYYYD